MKRGKKKNMWTVIGIIVLLLAGYSVWAVTPNLFARKGPDPETAGSLVIVAHRGGAGLGLENTLSCIERGILAGAEMIEIDVHLTKDGHLIVCHDITVDRTTDGTGRIEDLTLNQLQALHITDKDGNPTEERLPTLDEVMSALEGRVQLLIEVKRKRNMYAGIEQKLVEAIRKHQAHSWAKVQSFNDSVLENVHRIGPSVRLEKLILAKLPGLPVIFDGTFTRFSYNKYSYISSFNLFHRAARRTFINGIRQRGKEVKLWTVDEPERIPSLPVDGVITDRPDLWMEALDRPHIFN